MNKNVIMQKQLVELSDQFGVSVHIPRDHAEDDDVSNEGHS